MARSRTHGYWYLGVLALASLYTACGGGAPITESFVAVRPATSFVFSAQTLHLSATSGGTVSGLTWSVNGTQGGNPSVGTVDQNGNYVAPTTLTSLTTVTVTAADSGNPTRFASASVVVMPTTVTATGNPLVAQYSIGAPGATQVTVDFGPDTNYGLRTWTVPAPAGGGTLNMLVAGMRQSSVYHMRASVQFPNGSTLTDNDQTFTTGAVPAARVPQVTVTNPNGLTPTGGVVMMMLTTGNTQHAQAAAVDNSGNLVWYYDYPPNSVPQPVRLLPNGHLLVNVYTKSATTGTSGDVREIDLAGNIYRQFTADDLNVWLANAGFNLQVFQIHHDVIELPNGHLIMLVNHYKDFTDLPGYPGTTSVLGDAVVDLDPNLKPVWVWDSFDHLDVNRHLMAFPDWTHSNALVYSPDDGNLLVSMRHQSWVIKLDYEDGRGSGDVLWRLGYQGDFTLQTGGDPPAWFFAQHYPDIISTSTAGIFDMIVFDDGDFRVLDNSGTVCGSTGTAACHTRVPIFEVNEATKTAGLKWVYDAKPEYSFWGGSAQQIADMRSAFGITTLLEDPTSARYLEVTQDIVPQVVLEMLISGQNAYRAVHLPSLYPGVQW